MLFTKSEIYLKLKHFTFIIEDESAAEHRYISIQTNRGIKIKVVDNGIKISGDTESLGKIIHWILTGKNVYLQI